MRAFLAAFGFLVALSGQTWADVTVVRSVQMEGMGGFGGGPKVSTHWIAPDRRREEQKGEGKPSMIERMAGIGRPEITRLDKKVRWTLDVPKKRYQEMSLVVPVLEDSKDSGKGSDSQDQRADDRADEKPTTRISKAEFTVTPLGQKKKVSGYDCEGYVLRMLLEMEDLETRKKSQMKMVSTFWNTAETGDVAKLHKEETDYAKAYSKALGFGEIAKIDFKEFGATMIAGMAGAGEKELSTALAKMPAEIKKMKGYPIVTRVEWYGDPNDESERGDEPEEDGEVEIPTDVSSALGNLAGSFAKKKMQPKKPAKTAEGQIVFALTTEIKSISTAAIPATTFEIPAGFKKEN